MLKWLEVNNFNLNKSITINKFDDERGYAVVSTENIKNDEMLFQVPREMILNITNTGLSAFLNSEKCRDLYDWNKLTLALMWEYTNPNSRWREYLDILPHDLTSPLFWSEEELKLLQGSALTVERIGYENIVEDFKKNILPILLSETKFFNTKDHTFKEYMRFGSIIMAYSFTNDETGEIAMVPFADTLNHKTGHNNARLFLSSEEGISTDENIVYVMKTIKDINKGDELYNTYGDLSNAELLKKYGFTDDPNPFDVVDVPIELVFNECKLINSKAKGRFKYIQKLGLVEDDSVMCLESGKVGIPYDIDFLISILICPDEDYEKWTTVFQEDDEVELEIEIDDLVGSNEEDQEENQNKSSENLKIEVDEKSEDQEEDPFQKSLLHPDLPTKNKIFSTVLQKLLSAYPTTLQEDQEKIKTNISYNHKNALTLLISEKKILTSYQQESNKINKN